MQLVKGGNEMVTEFGKFLRKLRVEESESNKDMAKRIGISAAALSYIERGQKTIPIKVVNSIASEYQLTKEQELKLRQSAANSARTVTINFDEMEPLDRNIMATFIYKFAMLDERKIMQLIEGDEKKTKMRCNNGFLNN